MKKVACETLSRNKCILIGVMFGIVYSVISLSYAGVWAGLMNLPAIVILMPLSLLFSSSDSTQVSQIIVSLIILSVVNSFLFGAANAFMSKHVTIIGLILFNFATYILLAVPLLIFFGGLPR